MTPAEIELQKLRDLGKEKKLWTLEVFGKIGAEQRRWFIPNLTGERLKKARDDMFRIGITFNVDPGHYRVMHPADIETIDIYRQESFFDDVDFVAIANKINQQRR